MYALSTEAGSRPRALTACPLARAHARTGEVSKDVDAAEVVADAVAFLPRDAAVRLVADPPRAAPLWFAARPLVAGARLPDRAGASGLGPPGPATCNSRPKIWPRTSNTSSRLSSASISNCIGWCPSTETSIGPVLDQLRINVEKAFRDTAGKKRAARSGCGGPRQGRTAPGTASQHCVGCLSFPFLRGCSAQ